LDILRFNLLKKKKYLNPSENADMSSEKEIGRYCSPKAYGIFFKFTASN
jgi:hypothetical protein